MTDYLSRARRAQCELCDMLEYAPARPVPENCPVCGAPLYADTARYVTDEGETLGCEACVNVQYH